MILDMKEPPFGYNNDHSQKLRIFTNIPDTVRNLLNFISAEMQENLTNSI